MIAISTTTRPAAYTEVTSPRVMVVVLTAAVFINYVDRGALSIAAPLMKRELFISNTQIGFLLSAFFWIYAPGQLLAGWLAQKFGARPVLAGGLALWSLATFATGFAGGFAILVLLRLILGLGETAIFPCSAKLFAQHARVESLGAPNGAFIAGMASGPVIGTLLGGLILAHSGWRPVFWTFGAASAVWLIPWLMLKSRVDGRDRTDNRSPRFLDILGKRSLWGVAIGHFSSTYALYFLLTWLPLYLVNARHFPVERMAVVGAVVYAIYATASALVGWGSDRLIKHGASASNLRKAIAICGTLGVAVAMLLCAQPSTLVSVIALCCSGVFIGLQTPMLLAVGQTFAGPSAGGRWMGVQNALGNISGITAPVITGWLVDKTGGFDLAFAVAAGVSIVGLIAWIFLVGTVRTVDWTRRA